MESSKRLSVIVPVYNVEQYLERCVDSILNQTVKELEIILVDDGSTDNSGSMCDAYAAEHANIRVHHKSNGGLTTAWKAGLELATGRYVGFVDSDDWIDADMYERMLTLAEQEDADVTVCGLVFDFEDPKIPKRNEISNFKKEVYGRANLEALFPTLINDGYFFGRTLQPARVTKLFRRSLLQANVQFPSVGSIPNSFRCVGIPNDLKYASVAWIPASAVFSGGAKSISRFQTRTAY